MKIKGIPEDNSREVIDLKSRLLALEKSVEEKADLLPVGTILLSHLTLENFQKVYGSGWVRLEDKYPEARGRFFRLAQSKSELGTTQEDTTAVNSLSVETAYTPGKIQAKKTVYGSVGSGTSELKMWETNTPAVPGPIWRFFHKPAGEIKSDTGHCIFGSGSETEGRLYGGHGNQKIIRDTGHSHSFKGSVDLNQKVSGSSVSCSLKSTDKETRPKSFLLNAFIRVS